MFDILIFDICFIFDQFRDDRYKPVSHSIRQLEHRAFACLFVNEARAIQLSMCHRVV